MKELRDSARKAVRKYAEGIRSAEDHGTQLVYEDALVDWICLKIAGPRNCGNRHAFPLGGRSCLHCGKVKD